MLGGNLGSLLYGDVFVMIVPLNLLSSVYSFLGLLSSVSYYSFKTIYFLHISLLTDCDVNRKTKWMFQHVK